ncbi:MULTISPECIES: glycine cleavage system protein GcvH [Microbispora]|uniref:Glycine cleavage system H protein n=3 Tax=Microbispora TaxID=2005 RepID=A0ABY3LQ71_9ACTN|nr:MULTISPECIES: glycine cleavage system protein GcvH [Microbispora]GLW24606.1 glycine cleavage system H protein [Microbispora amethystogenes]MBO4270099.1 glycine cleavage system protein GcvH [Microbispora triticiradicis]RGA04675.1 glycine cleavage system protein GcvH [Microbispora triticiradicis]TLP55573.1 glycine cleavage system protein GcvH [Microbispora fusca]TYB47558.1 glycine cleavage system protein GcvH [Microbispora tritici]
MSSIPEELSYTKEHEWVAGIDDGLTVTVGITEYAAEQLGDVVFVQVPEAGTTVAAGDAVGEVESTKSVSDIFAPVGGEIVEINSAVVDDPSLLNTDPYGDGWLFRVRVEGEPEDLLSAAEYGTLTSGES